MNQFVAPITPVDPKDPFPDTWPERSADKPSRAGGLGLTPSSKNRFERTSTNDLMAATFDPLKAIVPGYVYGGFSVLAGRQKLGKTWLGIDWAVAVATGGVALGSIDCAEGDVLYIDMENGPRRIQSRIRALFPHDTTLPDMSRLEWVTDAPALDKGFLERLEQWRLSVSDPRLVVIDVLQRIKPAGIASRNAYENDYSIWAPLQKWATAHGVAVVGLHHTKKGGADDPLEALSGSNGLSACADTTIVLDQDQNGRTLYVRGRDVEEKETAVRFLAGAWSVLGEAAEVRRSDERVQVIAAVEDHGEPMTPAEIVSATGKPRVNIQKLLGRMAKAGEIFKVGRGRYWTEDIGHTSHTSHIGPKDAEKSVNGDDADVTANVATGHFDDVGAVSNRHKCAHCGKRGNTTLRVHDQFCQNWLHDECLDIWSEGYRERIAFLDGGTDAQ
ncbi:AAA family ATPase [Bradyrhizobium guangzhouense]|uniref:AAA family ATPase n=1 Tax=Bradyrhizobium guangzhouense TaxID=1325095 RepID=UPI001009D69B|nr:AAA family ATPase [Bradyrhizobium guangzhouense]RXH15140.1 hypothetical protein EAS54_18805 [Bradyrhizobium guangzhouense]